jgi:outer membrane protein TolC
MKRPILLLAALLAAAGAPAAAAEQQPALTLGRALELAEQRNPGLEVARAEIARARADLKYSWALLLPTAGGSLTFTHNDHPDRAELGPGQSIVVRRQDDLRGNLSVNLPLISARGWLGVHAARLGPELSRLSRENLLQLTLLTVSQTYFAALSARKLIQVHQTQIEAIERHREVAELRHRTGTGQRIDVVRARTELLTSRENLIAARTAYDKARDSLAALIGVEGLPVPQPIAAPPPPAAATDELVAQALRRREDVRLRRMRVELADRQLLGSWMAFVPSLNFTWQLNQQITDPSALSDEDKSRWFYGLTLNVPLYDHTRYAELDQMRAELARAEAEATDAEVQAGLEVRQARRDWQKSEQLAAAAAEKAALAAESLKLAELAYANGTGDSLSVTDARRTERQAQIQLEAARFDAQLALLQLLRACGRDLRRLDEPAAGP